LAPCARSLRSLRRKPGRKPGRALILIIGEGDTERAYFRALCANLRLPNIEVQFSCRQGSAPINIVDCAVQKAKEPGGYESIWCVFDRDEHESFARARAKLQQHARRMPLHEALSIPCFELWLLLHFEFTDALFPNCNALIQRLRQHLPQYIKANAAQARALLAKLEDALLNAQRLESRYAHIGDNPSTSVHRLVRHLQDIAAKDSRA